MEGIRRFRFKIVFVLIFMAGILVLQSAAETAAKGRPDQEESPVPTAEPAGIPDVTFTPVPTRTPGLNGTPVSTRKPVPTQAPEPTRLPENTPLPKTLKKVKGVTLTRYATNAIKVEWKRQKGAKYYRVYYSRKKEGAYRCAGVTKDTHYLVKRLKKNKIYYFYVQACRKKKKSDTDSVASVKVHMKTRTYNRKTVFAGDSICEAIGMPGWAYPYMHIGGQKKVIAYRGLNTVTFHTKRIFKGRTGLQKLISENPYRVYMMLGMNEVHYRRARDMIAEYRDMIRAIRQACPGTDIVLCAVSPVTRAEWTRRSGYRNISVFNKKLKKLAGRTGVRYFDYTAFLKDSGGYLKTAYAERDGYHWRMPVYADFAKIITRYDRSLDR